MNKQVVSLLFFAAPLGLAAGPGVPRSDARLSPDQAECRSIVEHSQKLSSSIAGRANIWRHNGTCQIAFYCGTADGSLAAQGTMAQSHHIIGNPNLTN